MNFTKLKKEKERPKDAQRKTSSIKDLKNRGKLPRSVAAVSFLRYRFFKSGAAAFPSAENAANPFFGNGSFFVGRLGKKARQSFFVFFAFLFSCFSVYFRGREKNFVRSSRLRLAEKSRYEAVGGVTSRPLPRIRFRKIGSSPPPAFVPLRSLGKKPRENFPKSVAATPTKKPRCAMSAAFSEKRADAGKAMRNQRANKSVPSRKDTAVRYVFGAFRLSFWESFLTREASQAV